MPPSPPASSPPPLPPPPPPPLEYGNVATRHGVTCEPLPDGGVRIVFPGRFARLRFLLEGDDFFAAALRRVARFFHRSPPEPAVVIELTSQHLRIDINEPYGDAEPTSRRWPRHEVGELRANRYAPGLLVRIPGKENFDILAERDPALIRWIGAALTDAIARTAPRPAPPRGS